VLKGLGGEKLDKEKEEILGEDAIKDDVEVGSREGMEGVDEAVTCGRAVGEVCEGEEVTNGMRGR